MQSPGCRACADMKRAPSFAFRTTRRRLVAAAGLICVVPTARAQTPWPAIPALETMLGSRTLQSGRVNIVIPRLADNGNSVPLLVTVESPMNAQDRVTALHVFSERNPR